MRVRTERTLRLTDMETLARLGVDEKNLSSMDPVRCQEIGLAAHLLEFDSVLVPSARWSGLNLVLFLDHISLDDGIRLEGEEEVNWPAWKERESPRG